MTRMSKGMAWARLSVALASGALLLLQSVYAAGAATLTIASVTIYPGDLISNSQLRDEEQQKVDQSAWLSRTDLVGRIAKRTLLKDQPIPIGSVEDARAFKVGSQVRLIFQEEGLTIVSSGMALQTGVAGDHVRVRNTQSGQIVVGLVQQDGSIKVGEK